MSHLPGLILWYCIYLPINKRTPKYNVTHPKSNLIIIALYTLIVNLMMGDLSFEYNLMRLFLGRYSILEVQPRAELKRKRKNNTGCQRKSQNGKQLSCFSNGRCDQKVFLHLWHLFRIYYPFTWNSNLHNVLFHSIIKQVCIDIFEEINSLLPEARQFGWIRNSTPQWNSNPGPWNKAPSRQ